MGTLTTSTPRLPDHCLHKLPSSCRLTSTPLCCACYDRRPHSSSGTYSVYVDGVGFVSRGTRWQNYCWFCKTFWENRVCESGLESRETRIPEVPEQTGFVERWFEWHQGYRVVMDGEGREERVPLVGGEELSDVEPGRLPRTADAMRRRVMVASAEQRLEAIEIGLREVRQIEVTQPVQPIEETLDDLLQEAVAQEREGQRAEAEDAEWAEQRARIGSVRPQRREIERPEAGARSRDDIHRRRREIAAYHRLFGTAEEIQSPEYVSPIAGMFNRAWERHRRFQELRRAQEGTERAANAVWWYLDPEQFPRRPATEGEALGEINSSEIYQFLVSRLDVYDRLSMSERENLRELIEDFYPDIIVVSRERDGPSTSVTVRDFVRELQASDTGTGDNEGSSRIVQILSRVFTHQAVAATLLGQRWRSRPEAGPAFKGLDGDDRPEPLEDEQMMVKLECKICLSQIADTAVLPCGHLSMCTWCADQCLPVKEGDKTRPQSRHARCPVCRRSVKQRVKIYAP